MHEIEVHFYEDVFTEYTKVIVLAENEKEFDKKLEAVSEVVIAQAQKENIKIAGARYDLPDEWKKSKKRKRSI